MGNEKWMAMHTLLFSCILVSQLLVSITEMTRGFNLASNFTNDYFIRACKVYLGLNTLVTILVAYIMN